MVKIVGNTGKVSLMTRHAVILAFWVSGRTRGECFVSVNSKAMCNGVDAWDLAKDAAASGEPVVQFGWEHHRLSRSLLFQDAAGHLLDKPRRFYHDRGSQ